MPHQASRISVCAMPSPLKIFITGASSGIGSALARRYAANGAILGLAARRSDELNKVAATLGCDNSPPDQQRVALYPLDVTDAAALHNAAADFTARFGAPDIVIANAGISVGTLTEKTEDLPAFRRVMDVNVYGMIATFTPFIATMKNRPPDQPGARLVGIASVAGIRGLPGAAAYSASKAAAITCLESLRLELRDSNIKVVTIAPGYIDTPMTEVNTYPMPFLLPVDIAAERFIRTIARGTSYTVIPWQMGVVAKLLRILPNALYDRLLARAPRKSRTARL